MNTQLTKLLLEQVFLPGRYPHFYPNSLAEYSDQEIRDCEIEMEKLGLLKFWESKASSSNTYTDNWIPYTKLEVTVNKEICEKFLASIK